MNWRPPEPKVFPRLFVQELRMKREFSLAKIDRQRQKLEKSSVFVSQQMKWTVRFLRSVSKTCALNTKTFRMMVVVAFYSPSLEFFFLAVRHSQFTQWVSKANCLFLVFKWQTYAKHRDNGFVNIYEGKKTEGQMDGLQILGIFFFFRGKFPFVVVPIWFSKYRGVPPMWKLFHSQLIHSYSFRIPQTHKINQNPEKMQMKNRK